MCRRLFPLLLAALLAGLPARADDELQRRFGEVEIQPVKASILFGNVTLAMPPFVRRDGAFHSTYSATVFPYFFFDETGKITIDLPEEAQRRVARGEEAGFTGRGINQDGEARRIEGRVEPVDATSGRIQVRIFISRRISLTFATSYRLKPIAAAGPPGAGRAGRPPIRPN